jgi:hypothetical protein
MLLRTLLWEAAMPSPVSNSSTSGERFWPSIARILLVEILLLVVLSGAVVGYLNWSSEVAWAEFKAASEQSAQAPNPSLHVVKGQTPCDRKA